MKEAVKDGAINGMAGLITGASLLRQFETSGVHPVRCIGTAGAENEFQEQNRKRVLGQEGQISAVFPAPFGERLPEYACVTRRQ
jgi:hypothetical protein